MTNTILWGDTPDEIYTPSPTPPAISITYSDIQGGYTGEGNIDADPLLVGPGDGYFHLQAGSPCIDVGDPNSPLDPDDTRADMGALYYDQSIPPYSGPIRYVSPSGDDTSGDGSEANPWRTIQHAIDQANSGDTIKVMDDDDEVTDDYTENITADKRLTIERHDDIGASPQVAASDASNYVVLVTADSVAIEGLDIYGATEWPNAGIFLLKTSGCTIRDNWVTSMEALLRPTRAT